MRPIGKRIFNMAATLAVIGCHRDLPEGISQQSLDALVKIADEAVKQCDTILNTTDCRSMQGLSGDPNKAVVLNAAALLRTPELRLLYSSCDPGETHWPAVFPCESITIDRGIDRSEECGVSKGFGSWPIPERGKAGIGVYVNEKPECRTPMPMVIVWRKSPKGALFDLRAVFISKKWLDTHPTDQLKPRPLPKKRDWLPLEQ